MSGKKTVYRLLLAVLVVLTIVFAFSSCGDCEHRDANDDNRCDTCEARFLDGPENPPVPGYNTAPVTVIENGQTEYELVYGEIDGTVNAATAAYTIADNVFYSKLNVDLKHNKYDESFGKDKLIVVGEVDGIEITERLAAEVNAKPQSSYAYGIAYEDGILAIYVRNKASLNDAPKKSFDNKPFFVDLASYLSSLISNGKLVLNNHFYYVYELTEQSYQLLVADDVSRCEERAQIFKEDRLDYIAAELLKFNTADFGTAETGSTLTKNFGLSVTSPVAYPKSEHPRVLFTAADVPAIRAKLESSKGSYEYERFMSYIDTENPVTGKLPAPVLSPRGYHNWDGEVLNAIQANALYYALYGDVYYGYTAIYAIKNFLLTLKVDYIVSDQCREFGNVMYIAACVYDWCYDLLSDDDKLQIATGVEHKLCRGEVPNTLGGIASTSSTVKMEVGFPPSSQHSLVGHGSEYQFLRDYLSFSIAVFDELPDWYEFIGGRLYSEFVPVRQTYYSTGLYPQGTATYGIWRFLADCYAAALITTATGINPYTDAMTDVLFSFASHETTNSGLFLVGDGSNVTFPYAKVGYEALILQYLFADSDKAPLLKLMASEMVGEYSENGIAGVRCPEYFIFASKNVNAPPKGSNWRDYMALVTYNGGFNGQYIVRNSWDDNAAAVFMKIGEMTTANHDHEDAGTFQIHYKGLTTGPSGVYDSYGSTQWSRYYQATVSKNGILIYDPEQKDTLKGWYTGSQQTKGDEPINLEAWQAGNYDRAVVTGKKDGVSADGVTPEFVYLAGDITKSYSSSQASYVGRSMLTVYTGNEDIPMIFFVFDRIDAQSESFVKKFLLQVNGEQAPTIDNDNKTVTITDADGKLVLQNVLGCDEIVGIGGGPGQNYLINDKQCIDENDVIDEPIRLQNSWGRVELHKSGNKSDLMLNVLYVTDADNDSSLLEAKGVSATDADGEKLLEGSTVGNITAMFATEKEGLDEAVKLTAEGSGDMTYYIGGLTAGSWNVYVGTTLTATKTVAAGEGIISFTAPAGAEITLEPVA